MRNYAVQLWSWGTDVAASMPGSLRNSSSRGVESEAALWTEDGQETERWQAGGSAGEEARHQLGLPNTFASHFFEVLVPDTDRKDSKRISVPPGALSRSGL